MRVIVLILALALLGLSGISAFFEAKPFLARAQSFDEQLAYFSKIAPGAKPVSIFESMQARDAWLDSCFDVLRAVQATAGRNKVPRPLNEGCLTLLESILARAPLSSNTWYMSATLANRLGDKDRTDKYLLQSFETGADQEWIADRRALYTYDLRDKLSPELVRWMDRDLLVMLHTNHGVQTLARRFVRDSDFRAYLIGLAEGAEPSIKLRLIGAIRAAMQEPQPHSP